MLRLFISLYPFFSSLLYLLDTCCSERCLWKLALAMYAYPLECGVLGAIDKPECLAYGCCCVVSAFFGKLPYYFMFTVSNKRITANQIILHSMA